MTRKSEYHDRDALSVNIVEQGLMTEKTLDMFDLLVTLQESIAKDTRRCRPSPDRTSQPSNRSFYEISNIYNNALIYFWRSDYSTCIDLLEPWISSLDNMDDVIAFYGLYLLIEACNASLRFEKSLFVIQLLEKRFGIESSFDTATLPNQESPTGTPIPDGKPVSIDTFSIRSPNRDMGSPDVPRVLKTTVESWKLDSDNLIILVTLIKAQTYLMQNNQRMAKKELKLASKICDTFYTKTDTARKLESAANGCKSEKSVIFRLRLYYLRAQFEAKRRNLTKAYKQLGNCKALIESLCQGSFDVSQDSFSRQLSDLRAFELKQLDSIYGCLSFLEQAHASSVLLFSGALEKECHYPIFTKPLIGSSPPSSDSMQSNPSHQLVAQGYICSLPADIQPETLYNIGLCFLAQKNYSSALECFYRVLSNYGRVAPFLVWLRIGQSCLGQLMLRDEKSDREAIVSVSRFKVQVTFQTASRVTQGGPFTWENTRAAFNNALLLLYRQSTRPHPNEIPLFMKYEKFKCIAMQGIQFCALFGML